MRLILASGSPRRREMLRIIGLPFEVARPDIDETPQPAEAPDVYVARLSREKNAAIVADPDSLILTADTTVADGSFILGKPATPAEAAAMLARLRDRTHLVHTGITLRDTRTDQHWTQVTTTQVIMRAYADHESQAYIDAGEPFDKAGSYAIQDATFHPVARYDGCYANVMGLPLCTLCKMLTVAGMPPPSPVQCTPDGGDGSRCDIAP